MLSDNLLQGWEDANQKIFGPDLDALTSALGRDDRNLAGDAINPIARLAAVWTFHRYDRRWMSDFFASGSRALEMLPLQDMANTAADYVNALPPLPPTDGTGPDLESYRTLGAMAMLEASVYGSVTTRDIGRFYTECIDHIRSTQVTLAHNPDRKPIGYAAWNRDPDTGRVVIHRQIAPFGNHLELQGAIAAAAGKAETAIAHHPDSARAAQVAW